MTYRVILYLRRYFMYRIKYIQDTRKYQIHSSRSGAFEGTLTQVTEKAIEIGMSQDELVFAYQVMSENKDTIAEFGLNGCFLYSHKGNKAA